MYNDYISTVSFTYSCQRPSTIVVTAIAVLCEICTRVVQTSHFYLLKYCMKRKHGNNYITWHILKTRVMEHEKGVHCATIALDLVLFGLVLGIALA